MAETRTLEEALRKLQEETLAVTLKANEAAGLVSEGIPLKTLALAPKGAWLDAARAYGLAVLEEAMSVEHNVFTWHDLQRRIKELGK